MGYTSDFVRLVPSRRYVHYNLIYDMLSMYNLKIIRQLEKDCRIFIKISYNKCLIYTKKIIVKIRFKI